MIYFVQEEDTKNIKIGRAKNPAQRLRDMQVGNSSCLGLLGCFDVIDDQTYEKKLHRKFKDQSVRGEWFKSTDKLLSLICDIKNKEVDVSNRIFLYEDDIDHLVKRISETGKDTYELFVKNIERDIKKHFPGTKFTCRGKREVGSLKGRRCTLKFKSCVDIEKVKRILMKYVVIDSEYPQKLTQFQYWYGHCRFISVGRDTILSSCISGHYKDDLRYKGVALESGIYDEKGTHKFCVFKSEGKYLVYAQNAYDGDYTHLYDKMKENKLKEDYKI